ncbi:MAG: hypothetical protein EXX96DRAFT_619591 [Benjaminiella poitrasii]|nr:MAG: hypothetical protein EXX96DRAFT_619591 [Benjaminiella poitrasii]
MSDVIRQVVFRAQLFMNSTVVNDSDLPTQPQLCDGHFWYSICQLIMEKEITNKDYAEHYMALPTGKTASIDKLCVYMAYVLDNVNVLFNFYGYRSAKFIFHNYQGKQRSIDELGNILIDGGKKYNEAKRNVILAQGYALIPRFLSSAKGKKKDTKWKPLQFTNKPMPILLVVYGDGMRNKDNDKWKGHVSGVTGMVHRKLLQRQSCSLAAVVDIDKFRTSKCENMSLENVKIEVDGETFKLRSTLSSKSCGVLSNRDPNSSKNMLNISLFTWNGHKRPAIYERNSRSEGGTVSSDQTA